VSLSAVANPASAELAATGPTLAGTGSSFAAPAISSWVSTADSSAYGLNLHYVPSNSGTGRFEFANQTVNWAVSDIGYVGSTDATPPTFAFNFVPITAGGIAFM